MFLDGLLLSNPLLRRTKNTAPIYFFIQQVVLSANVFHNNVYFFIHAVGLFYILPYTQSDSRPTSFRTTYIFSYTQSVTCILLHTHDRRLSGQRIFFHTHNRTRVYFSIPQSDSWPTSFRTTYLCSCAQSEIFYIFHTHSWTRGQGLSGQRFFF